MAINRKKIWRPRERLTAEDLNGEIDNIINNMQAKNCAGCGVEEDQVLATTKPDSKNPPVTVEHELKWLRHKIKELTGRKHWYDPGGVIPMGIAGMHRGLVVERTADNISVRADSIIVESLYSQRKVEEVQASISTEALAQFSQVTSPWVRLFLVVENDRGEFKHILRCNTQLYREFTQGIWKDNPDIYCAPLSIIHREPHSTQNGSQVRLATPLPLLRNGKDKQLTALAALDIPSDIKSLYLVLFAGDYGLEVSTGPAPCLYGIPVNKLTVHSKAYREKQTRELTLLQAQYHQLSVDLHHVPAFRTLLLNNDQRLALINKRFRISYSVLSRWAAKLHCAPDQMIDFLEFHLFTSPEAGMESFETTLKRFGYYPCPEGFESLQARSIRAAIVSLEKRKQFQKLLLREQFNKLDPASAMYQRCLEIARKGAGWFLLNPLGQAAQHILFDIFLQLQGPLHGTGPPLEGS